MKRALSHIRGRLGAGHRPADTARGVRAVRRDLGREDHEGPAHARAQGLRLHLVREQGGRRGGHRSDERPMARYAQDPHQLGHAQGPAWWQ